MYLICLSETPTIADAHICILNMVHESQYRIEIPPQVRTTKNWRLKKSFFPPLRNKSAEQRKRRKKRELHDLEGKREMVWYKEMRCILGMVFFSFAFFLLPGLRWRRGDEVTESRDDDRYGHLSLRSPNHSLLLSLSRSLRSRSAHSNALNTLSSIPLNVTSLVVNAAITYKIFPMTLECITAPSDVPGTSSPSSSSRS